MIGTGERAEIGSGMRRSGAAFGLVGALAVIAGVASVLLGAPTAAGDLAPVRGVSDLTARLTELSLPLCAAAGAVVAAVISILLASRRLHGRTAAVELLVLAVAIEVSLLAAAHRIGYAPDGAVLPAAVVCLAGGAAVLVAAFATAAAGD